jgi:hypothetical protein
VRNCPRLHARERERERERVKNMPDQLSLILDRPVPDGEQEADLQPAPQEQEERDREKTLSAMTGISACASGRSSSTSPSITASWWFPPRRTLRGSTSRNQGGSTGRCRAVCEQDSVSGGRLRAMDREAYESLFGQDEAGNIKPNLLRRVLRMETIKVRIEGTAPLMQHRYVFKDELAQRPRRRRCQGLQRRVENGAPLGRCARSL